MSLDGLRAWIGEVERKLGVRTRVFLVLVAIAVGGAGAAIYLAIDARDNSVSKADVQAVRDELEGRVGAASDAADLAQLEAELRALRAEVAQLGEAGGATNGAGGDSGGTAGGKSTDSTDSGGKQLLESIEKAKEQAGK